MFGRLLEESKSGKQALREFGAMAFGVLCMFLVACVFTYSFPLYPALVD